MHSSKEDAPGVTPDGDSVLDGCGEAATGALPSHTPRLSQLLTNTKAMALRLMEYSQAEAAAMTSRVGGAAASAQAQACTYLEAWKENVIGVAEYAKAATAGSVVEPVKARLTQVVGQVLETKKLAMESAMSMRAPGVTRARAASANALTLVEGALNRAKATATAARERCLQVFGSAEAGALEYSQAARARAAGAIAFARAEAAARSAVTRAPAAAVYEKASQRALEAKEAARTAVADPRVRCSAASAASGAAAMGAAGGATGLAAGSAVGAAIGLVPALFTCAFSIPIGAAIGGGAGLAVGTAVGSSVGAVSGGAMGYRIYSSRDGICRAFSQTATKVGDCTDYVKGRAQASAAYARSRPLC